MELHPTRAVLLYAPKDAAFGADLYNSLASLRREGAITIWQESDIAPGEDCDAQVVLALATADLILIIISADLLASERLLFLIERAMQEGRARVIPVLARVSDWRHIHPLCQFSPLPANGVPITMWSDRDAAWLEVSCAMRRLVSPLMVRVWVESADRPPLRKRDILVVPQAVRCGSYRLGDKIRVGFQSDRACYVMLVNHGSSGRVNRLYPSGSEPAALCQDDVCHYFPRLADPFDFVLSGPPGREKIRALASPVPVQLSRSELEQLTRGECPPDWAEASCEFDIVQGGSST